MALTSEQHRTVAAYWAEQVFVGSNLTANFSLTDLRAAVQTIDNALDATLSQAVAAVGGTTTVVNGMASVIPAPVNGASAQQQTLLVCYVLMKRAGII